MLRRLIQVSVLVGGIAVSSLNASSPDMTCREYCFYSQGVCEGSGGTWNFTCEMISPTYEGECNLGHPCIPAPE